jgi:hypothetical protein
VAAIAGNEFLLEFLISKGADINSQTPLGFGVLSSAGLHSIEDNNFEVQLAVVQLLLSNNANPAVAKTSITPLQLRILGLIEIMGSGLMIKPLSGVFRRILQVLIDAGADINGVADDETNSTRIRYGYHLYFLTKTPHAAIQEEDIVETLLENRGYHLCYSTPLRILEVVVANQDWDGSEDELASCNSLRDFLKSCVAKSLHLFPVKGLPGYIEEDMEEWGKITGNGAKIELKQSNVDPEDGDNEDERSIVEIEEDDNDIEVQNSMC